MQILKFTDDVAAQLKQYLYLLVDPRDQTIFYIGKGKGNRVFDHENEAQISAKHSAKLNQIRAIQATGQEPEKYIITWGQTDPTVIDIAEGLLIDFGHLIEAQGFKLSLTNAMDSFHNAAQYAAYLPYGTVEAMQQRLHMPPVSLKTLADQHIALITIDPGKHTSSLNELLEPASFNSDKVASISLGNWSMNINNLDKIKYLLIVTHTDHIIIGAFQVTKRAQIIEPKESRKHRRVSWQSPHNIQHNPFVKPVNQINNITVGPNRRLTDIWFNLHDSGINVVDNKLKSLPKGGSQSDTTSTDQQHSRTSE